MRGVRARPVFRASGIARAGLSVRSAGAITSCVAARINPTSAAAARGRGP